MVLFWLVGAVEGGACRLGRMGLFISVFGAFIWGFVFVMVGLYSRCLDELRFTMLIFMVILICDIYQSWFEA